MYSSSSAGKTHESREFSDYRLLNPRGDAVIPEHLGLKYRAKLELRLSDMQSTSKHKFAVGRDFSWLENKVVFHITQTPCRFPGVLELNFGPYPGKPRPEGSVPRYKLMELPSQLDLRRVHYSGGDEIDGMRSDAIKGCLWRAKLTVSGSKSEIKERLLAHLESRYGSAGGDDAFSNYLRTLGNADAGVAGVEAPIVPQPARRSSSSATSATAAPVGAEEAAQPDKTLTFDFADVRRSHPEAVVAFRVFELESDLEGWVADSAEGCCARAAKPHNYRDHDVVRSGAEKHIAGMLPFDSWLVSLTMDARWAIFHSAKSIILKGRPLAVINEIRLAELPFLVNCSTKEMCESLALRGLLSTIKATSAGEVFTTVVPKKALTGRVLLLNQSTPVGRRILGDVVPKDREYAANGIDITDFGTFAEWNKAFEGIFATDDEADGVLEQLRVLAPSSSGRVRRPAAK